MSRTPEEVKQFVSEIVAEYGNAVFDNQGMKGALIGQLNKVCGSDGERKLCLHYLFGTYSSKDLTGAEWIALARWVDTVQVGDAWVPQENLELEANDICDVETGVYKPRKRIFTFD